MKPAYGRPDPSDTTKRVTCYVCGCPRCAEYPLAIRQQPSGPYFPFLETHEPPDGSEPPTSDGRILACFLCYSYLTKQWELYERDKVPPVKRIYWLKRVDNGPYTGVEVGVQSEYASQLLGLATDPPADVKRPGASGGGGGGGGGRPPHPPPVVAAAASAAAAPTPTSAVEPKRPRLVPPQPQPPTMPLPPPGVPPLPMGLAVSQMPQMCPQQEALDLSLDGRRGTKRGREDEAQQQPPPHEARPGVAAPSRPEALDLRMPDKNATTEVCYVCGDHHKKGTLVDIFAKQQSGNCPFFPSLMQHPRPSKSHPIEASGRVQACRDCFNHLQLQWDGYEAHKVPHSERNYSLRKRATLSQESTGFVCYKCGRECPSSSLNLMYCRPNTEKEPFYPFIQKLEPPDGASPISPQGMVQVCSLCSKTIPQEQKILQEREENRTRSSDPKSSGSEPTSAAAPPASATSPAGAPPNCQVVMTRSNAAAADGDSATEEASCYLCHQPHVVQVMHWLSMVVDQKNPEGMYFPFLKYQLRLSQGTVIEDGRVLACSLCYQHLSTQWAEYQKENVPLEHRQFSLRHMPINSQSPRLTPHSSPGIASPAEASPSHAFGPSDPHHRPAENNKMSLGGGWAGQPIHTLEVVPADQDPKVPTLPVITTQRALNVAINCFICSFHSKPGQTYAIRCDKPRTPEPFFPFLAKHQSAHPEARVDESYVLVCLCCFHSLILQWQHYEKAQVDHFARLYDTYNYTCYICSLKTYRKRLYLLPVKDYPFLKEHNRPPGGMVVDNGHSVVVCKDCYSSLRNQYIELERWGVPVDKRQYNWIQRPPPPEFHQDSPATGPKPIQGHNSGAQPQLADPGVSSPGSHPGTPPGGLPQPRGAGSPRGSHGPAPGSSSAMEDGVESQVSPGKVSEECNSSVSNAIPKTSATAAGPAASTDASCDGNTPSCFAPLQLKIGVARQGGTQPHTLTKRRSVASSEGLNSGDANSHRNSWENLTSVDQHLKKPRNDKLSPETITWESVTPREITAHHQHLEDQKSRQSVIRGFGSPGVTPDTDSRPQLSPHRPKQLLSPPRELQAKCS